VHVFALNNYPSHILFSILRPRQTGVEATKAIRDMGFDGLIIAVTGNALDEDVVEFYKSGADLVLFKPLQITQLEALLDFVSAHGTKSVVGSILRSALPGAGYNWVPFTV